MTRKKVLLTVLLLALILGLAACSSFPFNNNPNANPNRDYYEGTRGTVMRFSDPTSPPARMYYYSEATGFDDNTFDIIVEVHNEGASWTKGGIYVSGYDPNMIRIDEIDIPRLGGGWGDCTIDFGFIEDPIGVGFWDSFIGQIGCSEEGFRIYNDGEGFWGGKANLGRLFSTFTGNQNAGFLENINVYYDNMGEHGEFHLGLGDQFDLDLLNHGRGMLVLLEGLSFTRYNGQGYLLHPDDYNFPGGEMTVIPFTGRIVNWPKGLDKTERPMPFLVTNCYVYSTYAAPQVCIDPDPYGLGRKVCKPKTITYKGGTGAPVAITSIEQENTKYKVYFQINIKNVGPGNVFDMGYMERCSPYYPGRLSTQHLNKVYIIDARIGNQHLTCTPDRGMGVKLVNGLGTVNCVYNLEYQTAKSAYETPLIVEVAYGYAESMERRTMIKRAI